MSNVKELAGLGFLVDESLASAIDALDESSFAILKDIAKKENPFMINSEILSKIAPSIKVVKSLEYASKFTLQDVVKRLNDRYNTLQGILMRRVEFSDLVSINKLGKGNATVIGLVKDKSEKDGGFLISLEDSTGDVLSFVPKALWEKLCLDDVVAVSGSMIGRTLQAQKIVYPDVPIRPVKYSSESKTVSFDAPDQVDYAFFNNRIITDGKEQPINPPCMVDLEGVTVMVLLNSSPLDAIRRRYVSDGNSDFIIEPIPDVIVGDFDISANYKGITIVPKNKKIDLKTRNIS